MTSKELDEFGKELIAGFAAGIEKSKRGMDMKEIVRVAIDLEILEDLDGVDLKDRIIEGVCDQMQDVNYTLLSVEIVD
ncbi:hypothetical protein [Bacillus cereus]|nr:hypothetical protein bcere0004_53120 [Bacillus cereus BGSC 6E1]